MNAKQHEIENLRQDADEFANLRETGKKCRAGVELVNAWLRDARRPLDADPKLYADAQSAARTLLDLLSVINSRLLIAQSDAEIKRYALEFNVNPANCFLSIDGVKEMQMWRRDD